MSKSLRLPITLALLLVMLSSALLGLWRPIDDVMRSYRFSFTHHEPSHSIGLVEIDGKSLSEIGVWPWPRKIYADLIDRLIAADVSDIVLDVDFSAHSNPEDDAELKRALSDAGGYVMLATFVQQSAPGGPMQFNRPIDEFDENSTRVLVNVPIDEDGIARNYVFSETVDGMILPSVAVALTPEAEGPMEKFGIDFGLDIGSVARFSLVDVLNGDADLKALQGKQVIVGASALELRDIFSVPRYGLIPGAMLHLLAAETLRQNRALSELPAGVSVLVALALSLALAIALRWGSVWGGAACALIIGVAVELGAFLLQADASIMTSTSIIHAAQMTTALLALAQDLSDKGVLLATSTRAHAETRTVLDRVISDNFDGVLVADAAGTIVMASQMAQQILAGEDGDQLIGGDVLAVLPPELAQPMAAAIEQSNRGDPRVSRPQELVLGRGSGSPRTLEYVVTVSEEQEPAKQRATGYRSGRIVCLTFRDVTEKRHAEERLRFLATHDPLTGALSRSRLVEIIEIAMSDDARRAGGVTMFMLDLSRFKTVNDTLGHSYGDAVLKQLVSRLKSADLTGVARLGGDSFAMIRPGTFSKTGIENFCKAILLLVSEVYVLGEHRAIVGAKIGVTDSAVSGVDPDVLISHADMALSAAKAQPGNTFAAYDPLMEENLRENQEMELALRHAIALDQLHLVYQPQIVLETGEMVGVEALVRWVHPELGPVSPGTFIPVAEETGIIIELGSWILEHACREVVGWPGNIKLSVNVSPMQFEFGDIVAEVKRVLHATGLPASQLEIEITEGMLISNPMLITSNLRALRDLGIGIALDDFGTGYSSLSYLGRLPVDKIKIDQSFVRGLPADQEAGAIIRAIMTLSESLGKIVVAEGIENADQAWMLRLAGAHIGQGYHFGRPIRASEMSARIARGEWPGSKQQIV